MSALVTNNAWGALSTPITPEATQILLCPGQGSKFPAAVQGTSWFFATLTDSENNMEIVKCTYRNGDTLTVVRGADNTTALAFAADSRLELRPCAALFDDKVSQDQMTAAIAAASSSASSADAAMLQNLQNQIDAITSGYVTTAALTSQLASLNSSIASTYLKKTDAASTYVLKAGDTMTGGLTIKKGDLKLSNGMAEVSGNVTITGTSTANTFRSTSDAAFKTDVVDIKAAEGLWLATMLRPVSFKWKESGDPDLGFIAQEVRKHIPFVVKETNGTLAVSYQSLIAVAFAAIKGLAEELKALKEHVNEKHD
jgi:hypothetical protein